ncbi:MAG: vanadium-dependent haloperoxidase [Actinomycetes bacterium]
MRDYPLQPFASTPRRSRIRHRFAVLSAVSVVAALVMTAPPATARDHHSHGHASNDPTVVTDWNAIALSTLVADPTKKPQETFLYSGFVQAAVYDAVVGIRGRYEPYSFHEHADHHASAQAAAVAAAHEVLVTYSPYAKAALDASYAASLATLADGPAKTRGIDFGTRAADHLIALRANDGRNGPALFTQAPAPGVWRPTPPANLAMFVPWMGSVTPLLIRTGAQFDPGPPPSLTSHRYTRDYKEVKALGASTGSTRTAEQTATALFFSGNAAVQFNAAARDQVALRHLDIVRAARMLAAVDMSIADAIIGVWNAKLKYGFWRPITAINLADTDRNPRTTADPSWTPLLVTPPYPEYVSGYSGAVGAFARALSDTLGTRRLNLTLISTAVPGVEQQYGTAASVTQAVVDARVWLGIHFRTADTRGARLGEHVADYALEHYFEREG